MTPGISRFASIAAAAVFGLLQANPALAAAECGAGGVREAHAIAMHGEPKYPEGFAHFDYVDPQAPKGGSLQRGARGTFDSFNQFIPKGNAASTGSFETLTTQGSPQYRFIYRGVSAVEKLGSAPPAGG